MPITEAQATAQLALWLEADAAVSRSQSYEIAGRKLTRADAKEISEKIDYWSQKEAALARGGVKVRRVVPRDL